MRAMLIERTGPVSAERAPLTLRDIPVPEPGPRELRLRVTACGVCHTELDEIESRSPPPRLPIVPGHQVVGRVDARGAGATRELGERLGVGWIHRSSGRPDENLSADFRATGRDVNGGYAEYMTVPEAYAFPIPDVFSDEQAAPLLCAGAVGFRALRLTGLRDGEPLGLWGFGSSAHLVLQLARHLFPRSALYVFTRSEAARELARELGARWAGRPGESSPEPLRAAIDSTPAWRPVVEALASLAPGGRLVINALRKEDRDRNELLRLSYADHLWLEREIKTVANVTGRDLADFLPLAAQADLRPQVTVYPLEGANDALLALRRGGGGAKVLRIGLG